MDRYSDVVQNENGRAVPGASILIVGADGQPAIIFADRQGTPLANPVVTDMLGRWTFCAADGIYSARVSFGGVLKATVQDIRLEDPDDGFASLASPTGAALIGTASNQNLQQVLDDIDEVVSGLENYTLPIASSNVLGGIRIGNGLTINPDGIVSLTYSYTLPTASNTVLGGVKVGNGLAIDAGGVLSATGVAAGSVASVNGVLPNSSGAVTLSTDNLAEDSSPVNLWFLPQRVRDVALTGISFVTNAAITATDTVLSAAGKLQAQISALATALSGKQDVSGKDTSGGYVGLTAFALNIKNAAGTVTSGIASAATAARTYTLPDKSGTVAMTSDISGGTMVLLASLDTSGSVTSIDYPNLFTPAYGQYMIMLENISLPSSGAYALRIFTGGSTVVTANYFLGNGSGTANSANNFSLTSTTSGGAFTAVITLTGSNYIGTGRYTLIESSGFYFDNSATPAPVALARYGAVAGANMTGFQIIPQTATSIVVSSVSRVRVYGIKNSA